jgi:hypothetical protein
MAYLIPYRLIYFNLVKNSFAIKVVETWNRLTDRVKLTEKPESFKKEIKNYGLDSRTDGETKGSSCYTESK